MYGINLKHEIRRNRILMQLKFHSEDWETYWYSVISDIVITHIFDAVIVFICGSCSNIVTNILLLLHDLFWTFSCFKHRINTKRDLI